MVLEHKALEHNITDDEKCTKGEISGRLNLSKLSEAYLKIYLHPQISFDPQ